MREKLQRLGADTAVYGISTIVGRFLNFLLVPFYTNVLIPRDYGIVANVYSIIALATILYGYGMESAYFKYASTGEHGNAKENFSTPFISLFVTSAILSALVMICAPAIAGTLGLLQGGGRIVVLSASILFFDTLTVVPFAALRLERRARLFAFLKTVNIVVNVASNLILLLVFHAGVEGIFISGCIASGVTVLMLIPTILAKLEFHISGDLYKAVLKFGLPYVPAGFASQMIQVVDRPILRSLTNDATVGVYQANYRLGIFMMLIVSMYDYAWRPFFLATAQEPDAKRIFSRILTYFVLAGTGIILVLSFFMKEIVAIRFFGRTLIHPDYWSGLPIVPVVLFGYLFLGIYNNLIAGIYIEKKTQYLPAITIAGAVVNVGVNYLLIPSMGMMGAAIATLAAYAVIAGALYVVVQRFYPVTYEWKRIGLILLAGGISFGLWSAVSPPIWEWFWKVMLLLLFVGILALSGFFNAEESRALMSMLKKRTPRL